MRTLAPDDVRAVLDAAAGDRLEALYAVALTTGMRQGELLGLRWREVGSRLAVRSRSARRCNVSLVA
ncbi:MAG: hypothetical protein M3T56_15440 [Chloroflexota bacterium]|nr:hypothetical protein [Chloroflexota bacterium]